MAAIVTILRYLRLSFASPNALGEARERSEREGVPHFTATPPPLPPPIASLSSLVLGSQSRPSDNTRHIDRLRSIITP